MKVKSASIQQLDKDKRPSKCRRWRLWANTDDGRKSKRFSGTYTQAQDALGAWVAELGDIVPNSETFASYAESWRLWREKSGGLDIGTLANDKRNVNVLSRALGDKRMDAITPETVKAALVDIKTGGKRELSGTYMNGLFVALNAIMQTAANDGRIAANPCAKVKAPKCDTREREALTAAQMDAAWHAASSLMPDGRAMAVLLMLDAGLRAGEALALRPEDVGGGTVSVRRAVKERDGSIGDPKSPSAVRDVPMTDRLAEACAGYMAARPDCPTFCASTRSMPIRPQNFQRWWRSVRASLGCDGFTPHQLRHSNLTKMARYMSPFDLQRWAGWSSIGPAKVYVHADQSALEAAVARSQIVAVDRSGIICTETAPDTKAGQTA